MEVKTNRFMWKPQIRVDRTLCCPPFFFFFFLDVLSIKRVRSCNCLTEAQSTNSCGVYIKYLFMFQNDYKRLGHSVIRSIDCCMSIENSNDMSYRDQKWVSGIRYELDSIHNRWESQWMFCSHYLSYFYCSSKLVLAHAVLLKKNIWNQFCFRVCQLLSVLSVT